MGNSANPTSNNTLDSNGDQPTAAERSTNRGGQSVEKPQITKMSLKTAQGNRRRPLAPVEGTPEIKMKTATRFLLKTNEYDQPADITK